MPPEVGRRHIPPFPELSKIKAPTPALVLERAMQLTESWGRQLVDFFAGLPALHARTHKGGSDSVSGSTPPSPITPGQLPDVGDPAGGFAPIDHVHDGTLLSALDDLEDLAGTTVETLGGRDVTYVYNPFAVRLLELILLEVQRQSEEQRQAFEDIDKRLKALEGV